MSLSGSRVSRTPTQRRKDSAQRKTNYAEKVEKVKEMRTLEETEKLEARPAWMADKSLLPKRPPGRKP